MPEAKKSDSPKLPLNPDMFEKIIKNKKLFAGIVALGLFIFVAYSSIPFLSAFFGAAFLAYIFNPLNKRLRRRFSPVVSAWIVLIIALVIVIIPVLLIINGLINQIYLLIENLEKIEIIEQRINELFPGITIDVEASINQVIGGLSNSIRPIFTGLFQYFLILFLIFFFLYYFLLYSDRIKQLVHDNLPFSEKVNNEIILKFKQVTDATIIGTFFIAVVQGGLLAFNFYLLGIPNALFWGFITSIFSFIPFTGAPLVWGPAVIYLFLKKEFAKSVALFVIGMMISTIDNIIRPLINQKYGSIHPLVSIIGIFIGIYQFGIMGIFIGPLLVVYMILFWRIYRDEKNS